MGNLSPAPGELEAKSRICGGFGFSLLICKLNICSSLIALMLLNQ